MTISNVLTKRPVRTHCDHQNEQSTVNAGLKRIVCLTCNQVHVDFVDSGGSGKLFRIPRAR